MTIELQAVAEITPNSRDIAGYDRVIANTIILTADNRILLQRRMPDDKISPNKLACFGGGADAGETLTEALSRELAEELNAQANPADFVILGANTFTQINGTRLMATFFWNDRNGTVGCCKDGIPEYYNSAALVLAASNPHPVLHWVIKECVRRGLIPA